LIPVALASATAAVLRRYILGLGPLFPSPPHPLFIGPAGILACVFVGLMAGALSSLLTVAVYAAEDAFRLLPIHWMWWPAIGGLVVGIGGLIFPPALGVGYDNIGALLQGNATLQLLVGILLVKSVIWATSLGSGTSGGVLAPLLMMGGALGGLEALFLPNAGPGFWPLVSMGAILGGTMRSPFTGVIFALELTHDVNVLLPLLIAAIIAHGFTVLVMRRSILTEKISRRGLHLTREYAIDPLETTFVRDAMRPTDAMAVSDSLDPSPVVAYSDEPLRVVVYRMAETGATSLPVVERLENRTVIGEITLADMLVARTRVLDEEQRRERIFRVRPPFTTRNDSRSDAEA
jgi:CBS domain-containing protein